MIFLQLSRLTAITLLVLLFIGASPGSTSLRKDIKQLKLRNKKEGQWSTWSPWSPCSRPCGGGIRTQTRQCQIRRSRMKSKEANDESKLWKNVTVHPCEGHGTRHHLCNAEACPRGTLGIRESQCMTFDKKKFMGKVYQWEAFVDERNPCSLTCRAKGFRFFTTLKKSVMDGTPCEVTGDNGVAGSDLYLCVTGQCLSIGCDGIAGSQRRLDRCGVCGGDNSTCRVISGIFTRPQLPVGYNMVAHIPRGACNLNITQIRKSPNYLALRKNDGSYILNGNWAISWPGDYEGAGSKFHYTRQDSKSLESIDASGPLTEPVDLLVLSQQPNPGIKYEYMLPMNDGTIPPIPDSNIGPIPAPLSYRQPSAATLRPSAFVPLTRPPANDRTSLLIADSNSKPGGQVLYPGESAFSTKPQLQIQSEHPHLHKHQGKRPGIGHHLKPNQGGLDTKRFLWKVTGYTDCSETCGGGTQKAIIRCVKEATGVPVPDRRCALEKVLPQTAIRCNLKPCPAEWIVGSWSTCSLFCGEGTQTRTVNCQQRISPTLTMRVAEGACLSAQPVSQKSCFVQNCHRWEATPWSICSTTCGNGVRSRTAKCVDSEAQVSTQCLTEEKPNEISPCNMGPCEGVDWFTSEWSHDCSETCSAGIQTRHVLCAGVNSDKRRKSNQRLTSKETETNLIAEESNFSDRDEGQELERCDESRMPSKERECSTERDCRDAEWFAGPWTECSAPCGNGFQTRQVLCVLLSRGKFRIVDNSQCFDASKPTWSQTCVSDVPCPPRWFMTEWSECSVSCGGGTQRRSISCRSSNWTQTSFTCSDVSRPVDRRSCSEQECLGFSNPATTTPTPVITKFHDISREMDSRESSAYVPLAVPTTRKPALNNRPGNLITTSNTFMEPNEEPDSSECTDQYKNCALVVQARLCRYKYYRSVCCTSCADN